MNRNIVSTTATSVKRRRFSFVQTLVLALFLFAATCSAGWAQTPKGAGTAGSPYLISSLGNLVFLSQNVSNATYNASGVYYKMTKSINASSTATWYPTGKPVVKQGFVPIGTAGNPFRANFDGNHFAISGLTINRASTDDVGLFGYARDGSIKNLLLAGGSIKGGDMVGALVGTSYSCNITKCRATTKVTGTGMYVGGLVGVTSGAVDACSASGKVTGVAAVGGLIGQNSGNAAITNSFAMGAVTATTDYSGGLIGLNFDDNGAMGVTDCHATGAVTGGLSGDGGLIGYNAGNDITNCYATGAVTGGVDYVGGLIGTNGSIQDPLGNVNGGNITDCHATGAVTASYEYVGGLIGYSYNDPTLLSIDIKNSYATGKVTGLQYVGGLIGYNSKKSYIVGGSYATGKVIGTDTVGGLVGYNDNSLIQYAYASGAVAGAYQVGGLVGCSSVGTVNYCHATGKVTGSEERVGGLIGENSNSYIDNCYATGAGTSPMDVGGLVGLCDNGVITNSRASGAVVGGARVGGLVGDISGYKLDGTGTLTSGYITSCFAIGRVTGDYEVGGLVGYCQDNYIANSHATGAVTGNTEVGGLVGYLEGQYDGTHTNVEVGEIVHSEASGAVTGRNVRAGGLVGYAKTAEVYYSSAIGAVTGGYYVGGLVGETSAYFDGAKTHGVITAAYALGKVKGIDYVGGLVGFINGTDQGGSGLYLNQCYSVGKVVSSGDFVGGLVGENVNTLYGAPCYWDIPTSGQAYSAAGTGVLIDNDMKIPATFSGWDFASVWEIPPSTVNHGYPVLR